MILYVRIILSPFHNPVLPTPFLTLSRSGAIEDSPQSRPTNLPTLAETKNNRQAKLLLAEGLYDVMKLSSFKIAFQSIYCITEYFVLAFSCIF